MPKKQSQGRVYREMVLQQGHTKRPHPSHWRLRDSKQHKGRGMLEWQMQQLQTQRYMNQVNHAHDQSRSAQIPASSLHQGSNQVIFVRYSAYCTSALLWDTSAATLDRTCHLAESPSSSQDQGCCGTQPCSALLHGHNSTEFHQRHEERGLWQGFLLADMTHQNLALC